jgi:hypothetical protein
MAAKIRRAGPEDLGQIVPLLMVLAQQRHASSPRLWPLDAEAASRLVATLAKQLAPTSALMWFVAVADGRLLGVAPAMLLTIPPIYAGALGPPGLLLDDWAVTEGAPESTLQNLLDGAKAALVALGARVLIGSTTGAGAARDLLAQNGYEPLTMFMGKSGLIAEAEGGDVRPATVDDVPEIVAASAVNRATLAAIHPFWTPHDQADSRFDGWMRHSLTLMDRDMFVSDTRHGYAIAQPVARLLIPPAHDISRIGVIDDYYDPAFAAIAGVANTPTSDLLHMAEAALARRRIDAAMVVCPADWPTKRAVIKAHGYSSAKLWMIRHV